MRVLMLLVGLVVLPYSVSGRDFSLQEALQMARQHSFELKRARAEGRAAGELERAARAERLPSLSATLRATYVDDIPSFSFPLGPSGTIEREIGGNESYQTDLQLRLPLFTGGRLSSAVDRAHAISLLQEAIAAASDDEVLLQTHVAYNGLVKQAQLARAAQAAVNRARLAVEAVSSLHAAGAADSVDVLEAHLRLTETELEKSRADIERRRAEIRLLILLGLDPTEAVTVQEPEAPQEPPSFKTAVSDSKPEIAASRAALTARVAERGLARAERWPSLSLVGGYSFGKPNRDVFNNDWDDYFSIGLIASWSFNLGNSTGRRLGAAGHRIEAARSALDRTVELLDREARLAGEALELAHTQYQTASIQRRIAADNYRLATAKHGLGDLSTNRFLQVEESLAAADNALAASIAEFYTTRARFLFATGSDLLGKGY